MEKKTNVVSVPKKGGISHHTLLPIFGKIFERLIYNKMFEYFIESDLTSHDQSGFKPVLTICYLLQMRFLNLLMREMKLEMYFLTYQKPLIQFGKKVSFINLKKTVHRVI